MTPDEIRQAELERDRLLRVNSLSPHPASIHSSLQDPELTRLKKRINELEESKNLLESERDCARLDKMKLARWLKRNHPDVFRQYFEKGADEKDMQG